ncbi:MAG TPA: hypothetical protein VF040_07915 [Ktedonobacterales bacterium]
MKPLHQSPGPSIQPISGSAWRGFGRGLLPLLTLTGWVAVTLVLTLAARELTAGMDLGVRQWITPCVLVLGLVAAAVAYVVSLRRAFRAWRIRTREEDDASAAGMLWGLLLTAAVVALPIVVAMLVPQQPAP